MFGIKTFKMQGLGLARPLTELRRILACASNSYYKKAFYAVKSLPINPTFNWLWPQTHKNSNVNTTYD
jgi:hypothetical protein